MCLRRLRVQVQGKRGPFLLVLPRLTPSFASARSRLPGSSRRVTQPPAGLAPEGWHTWMRTGLQCCEADLNSSFLCFRCSAAVPHLEGTRHSQVGSTLPKFWGACTSLQDFTCSPSCCSSVPSSERALGAVLDKPRQRCRDGSMETFAQCPGAAQKAK